MQRVVLRYGLSVFLATGCLTPLQRHVDGGAADATDAVVLDGVDDLAEVESAVDVFGEATDLGAEARSDATDTGADQAEVLPDAVVPTPDGACTAADVPAGDVNTSVDHCVSVGGRLTCFRHPDSMTPRVAINGAIGDGGVDWGDPTDLELGDLRPLRDGNEVLATIHASLGTRRLAVVGQDATGALRMLDQRQPTAGNDIRDALLARPAGTFFVAAFDSNQLRRCDEFGCSSEPATMALASGEGYLGIADLLPLPPTFDAGSPDLALVAATGVAWDGTRCVPSTLSLMLSGATVLQRASLEPHSANGAFRMAAARTMVGGVPRLWLVVPVPVINPGGDAGCSYPAGLKIYDISPSGTQLTVETRLVTAGPVDAVGVVDRDGDGLTDDLVLSQPPFGTTGSRLSIVPIAGDPRTWLPGGPIVLNTGGSPTEVQVVDVNEDCHPDLVIPARDSVVVQLGDAGGTWSRGLTIQLSDGLQAQGCDEIKAAVFGRLAPERRPTLVLACTHWTRYADGGTGVPAEAWLYALERVSP